MKKNKRTFFYFCLFSCLFDHADTIHSSLCVGNQSTCMNITFFYFKFSIIFDFLFFGFFKVHFSLEFCVTVEARISFVIMKKKKCKKREKKKLSEKIA